jgi:acyl carrier protein
MVDERDAVYQDICKLLERYRPQGVELSPSTELAGDLNIDSVAAMDLVMEIEDKFGIDIPLNLASDLRRLEDLVQVVRQQMRAAE